VSGHGVDAYPAEYLEQWEVVEYQFRDRDEARRAAKELSVQGFMVQVVKYDLSDLARAVTWSVEGRRLKDG